LAINEHLWGEEKSREFPMASTSKDEAVAGNWISPLGDPKIFTESEKQEKQVLDEREGRVAARNKKAIELDGSWRA